MRYPGFVSSSKPSQSQTASIERLVNWYPERLGPVLLPSPGFRTYATTTDVGGRGLFAMNAIVIAVIGPGVWNFSTGVGVRVGTVVQDNNKATISYNGVAGGQIFITSGTNGYLYNPTTGAFTTVLNGTATMGGMKDGYFLAFNRTTGRVALSALNDGTSWDPTQYFARSIKPDPWVAMAVGDVIWMIGEQTSEAWYNAGAFPQPFAPILSSVMQAGTRAPSSVAMAGDAPIFVNHDAAGAATVVQIEGYTPKTVSDDAVATELSRISRTSTLTDAETLHYTLEGHAFIAITFPTAQVTRGLDLDLGTWHELGRWDAPTNRYIAWAPRVHADALGLHLVADRTTGSIYTMDVTFGSDVDGSAIRRLRIPPALMAKSARERITIDHFGLYLDPGVGLVSGQGSDPMVMLRTSQNARTWSTERMASAGAIGAFNTRVFWTRCGSSNQLWVPEITCSDPVPFRLSGAEVLGSGFELQKAAA